MRKWVHTALVTGSAMLVLSACAPGQETICELASQHVAACVGGEAVAGPCDGAAAERAAQVLSQDCGALQNQTRTIAASGGTHYRIGDCWQQAGAGWCYDQVSIAGSCTQTMDGSEYTGANFNSHQCLQPRGNGCRLARVCRPFKDKAECLQQVQHHNDLPPCAGSSASLGNRFRVTDCWDEGNKFFCWHMVKKRDPNDPGSCSELMDWDEWHDPQFSNVECKEPEGNRCRKVRACRPFANKGECINAIPHQNDQPKCGGQQPGSNQPPPPPLDGGRFRVTDCWNEGGGQFCFHMVKKANTWDPGACTEPMEWDEWNDPDFTNIDCKEADGGRCRRVRVCGHYGSEGECIQRAPRRPDSAQCGQSS